MLAENIYSKYRKKCYSTVGISKCSIMLMIIITVITVTQTNVPMTSATQQEAESTGTNR